MRTTIQLSETLLRAAKERAAKEGKTLKSLIEEGLRHILRQRNTPPAHQKDGTKPLPVSKCKGGLLPGVDLTDSRSLEDIMEEGHSSN